MAKWMAAEKVRTGLRHAVVCPNARDRTKDRTDSPKKFVCASSLAIVEKLQHKWRGLLNYSC